jgi:hypothetical protein
MRLPPPPAWMSGLPPLHQTASRIQPSLAASRWVGGKPIFSIDARRMRILGIRGRCWQCGHPLAPPGHVVVVEGDDNDRYGGLHTQAFGPLHRSCALYACGGACPFLRYRTARGRRTGHSPRGTASIQSFAGHGVFFPPSPIPFMCFGYWGATETIPLTNHACIADLYERAVIADAAANFTTTPRLYWTDAPDDARRLRVDWLAEKEKLQAWARKSVVAIEHSTYRGHALTPVAPPELGFTR